MNMDKDILEDMKDPYVEETHRRLATVAADTAKWFWGGIKKGFRGIKGIFKTVPKAEEDPNAEVEKDNPNASPLSVDPNA